MLLMLIFMLLKLQEICTCLYFAVQISLSYNFSVVAEQREWAYDIAIAALLGEGVYNFGELLSHTILSSLRGTEREWLVHLLEAFNTGDSAGTRTLRIFQYSTPSP